MKIARTLSLLTILILAGATILNARTWKEAGSDRSFDGDFVKLDGENVLIRMGNGATVPVPLSRFTEEDQAFAKAEAAKATTPTTPAPSATTEAADGEVVLSGVHLCCGGCETGIEKALDGLEGLEFDMSRSAKTVTLKGSNIAAALENLGKKGYYGESSSETLKIVAYEAKDEKTDSVSVNGVHLCCGKCVKAVDAAMANVEGFASHSAQKGESVFSVKGEDITPAAVLKALHAQGLSGIVR